jgi:hypothetical protein
LIERLREDLTYIPKLVEKAAQDFDDRKCSKSLPRVGERAWREEVDI